MAARSKKIRVGIAGLGRSGWDIHAALIGTLKSKYDVVAVFDQEDERLQEAERRFGCATYRRFRGLVHDDDDELVVVAMPSHLHARYTVEALSAGRHVVCEKPMATSLRAADRMIAATTRSVRTRDGRWRSPSPGRPWPIELAAAGPVRETRGGSTSTASSARAAVS